MKLAATALAALAVAAAAAAQPAAAVDGGGGGGRRRAADGGQLLSIPLDWDVLDTRLTFNFSVGVAGDRFYEGVARADFGSGEGLVYAVDGCELTGCLTCSRGYYTSTPGVCLCASSDRLPPLKCPSTGYPPRRRDFVNDTEHFREWYTCPPTGTTAVKLGPAGRRLRFDLPDLDGTNLATKMYTDAKTNKFCGPGGRKSSPVGANSGFGNGSPLLNGLYDALGGDLRMTTLDVSGALLGRGKPSIVVGGGSRPRGFDVRTPIGKLGRRGGRSVRITAVNGVTPPGGYEDVTVDTGNESFLTYCSGKKCVNQPTSLFARFNKFPLTIEFERADRYSARQSVTFHGPGVLPTGVQPTIDGGKDHTVLSLGFLNKFIVDFEDTTTTSGMMYLTWAQ